MFEGAALREPSVLRLRSFLEAEVDMIMKMRIYFTVNTACREKARVITKFNPKSEGSIARSSDDDDDDDDVWGVSIRKCAV